MNFRLLNSTDKYPRAPVSPALATLCGTSGAVTRRVAGIQHRRAVGLSAGISVQVCSNSALGGSMVLKRRHTGRIELNGLVLEAVNELEMEFLTLETVAEDLKIQYLKDDQARLDVFMAAEAGAINASDVLSVFGEFKKPRHEDFAEPTRWSLLAFTENAKKYSPARADVCYRELTRLFGLDGQASTIGR